jgi:membrane-bound lytic murein transglycosylase B
MKSLLRGVFLLILATGLAPLARAQQDFTACLGRLQAEARAGGIEPATIETVFASVEPRPRVIEADRNQAEFLETFADYFNRRVSERRVTDGRRLYAEHRALLDEVTRQYGVPGQYIVALWGLETNFGGYLGEVSVFDALSTLACDDRRSQYFSAEFVNALRVVDRGHVEPEIMIGSWAGAMGHTQFMPTNYLEYAVDGDGDGRVDLWNSVADSFASAANLLADLRWQRGFRWGREVRLPEDFDYALAGSDRRVPLSEWRALGLADVAGQPVALLDLPAALLVPSGSAGPAFLVYDNFDVIMRWNRSEFFALTVGHLADRIAGAGELATAPPALPRIARASVVRLQEYLQTLGYEPGGADGIMGPQSRAALRQLQRDRGLVADGFVTLQLLDALGLDVE